MIKHTLIVVAATVLLVVLAVLVGCQVDTQANSSIRFLMDGEGPESRTSWAFGSLDK